MSLNEILFRRKNKLMAINPANETKKTYHEKSILATFQKNLESSVGYLLSPEIMDVIKYWCNEDIAIYYNSIFTIVRRCLGDDKVYRPFYVNFPRETMELSEAELYLNAVAHYINNGYRPNYPEYNRPLLREDIDPVVIQLGGANDLVNIFKEMLSSPVSLSVDDYTDLKVIIENLGNTVLTALPESIPNKEILAEVSMLLIRYTDIGLDTLSKYYDTATDLLRFMVALSDGDISLAEKPHFKNIYRRFRKFVLVNLDRLSREKGYESVLEDMLKYKNVWIKAGEKLHPGEYKNKFPNANGLFKLLRNANNYKLWTTSSRIEESIKAGDIDNALESGLKNRPGEMARRMDKLLRDSGERGFVKICRILSAKGHQISTPVLVQLKTHLETRNDSPYRVFFPKGQTAKAQVVENQLPKIDENKITYISDLIEGLLKERFSQYESLGNVFIDPELENFTVPFSQRSASKSLYTVGRGSRFQFDPESTLRTFIWWKNGKDRADLDLSVSFYDENWEFMELVNYTNLRTSGVYHSGDVVDAPKGDSEFIDIDMGTCKKKGYRYGIVSVHSFTTQPFCDLPECFMGWMERKDTNSGEIYEPKTVKNKVDLTADTKVCIPIVIDFEESEIIWADMGLSYIPRLNTTYNKWGIKTSGNNVQSNILGLASMGIAITNLERMDLCELFELHAESRGQIVYNMTEADTVFDAKTMPYQIETILSEYLA